MSLLAFLFFDFIDSFCDQFAASLDPAYVLIRPVGGVGTLANYRRELDLVNERIGGTAASAAAPWTVDWGNDEPIQFLTNSRRTWLAVDTFGGANVVAGHLGARYNNVACWVIEAKTTATRV